MNVSQMDIVITFVFVILNRMKRLKILGRQMSRPAYKILRFIAKRRANPYVC